MSHCDPDWLYVSVGFLPGCERPAGTTASMAVVGRLASAGWNRRLRHGDLAV